MHWRRLSISFSTATAPFRQVHLVGTDLIALGASDSMLNAQLSWEAEGINSDTGRDSQRDTTSLGSRLSRLLDLLSGVQFIRFPVQGRSRSCGSKRQTSSFVLDM